MGGRAFVHEAARNERFYTKDKLPLGQAYYKIKVFMQEVQFSCKNR